MEYLLNIAPNYAANAAFGLAALIIMGLPMLIDYTRVSFKRPNQPQTSPCLAARRAAMTLGMAFAMVPYVAAPTLGSFTNDILALLRDGIAAAILLTLAGRTAEYLLMPKIDNDEALCKNNIAITIVEIGALLATGMVASGAVAGENGGMLSALGYFLAGQIVLIAIVWIYEILTPFDANAEVCANNPAVAIIIAGHLLAVALILRGAIGGPGSGYQSLVQTVAGVAFGLGALIIATWIMRLIILHRHSHTQVIAKDKNISIATTAAALQVGASAIIAASL